MLWLGLTVSVLAALYGLWAMIAWAAGASVVEGWVSLAVLVSFLSGVNIFVLGVVGLYIGRIHAEVKNRPLYVVEEAAGFDRGQRSGR